MSVFYLSGQSGRAQSSLTTPQNTALIDLTKMQYESELARQYDAREVQRNFEQSSNSDQNILEVYAFRLSIMYGPCL